MAAQPTLKRIARAYRASGHNTELRQQRRHRVEEVVAVLDGLHVPIDMHLQLLIDLSAEWSLPFCLRQNAGHRRLPSMEGLTFNL